MKTISIELTQNQTAIIDAADLHLVQNRKWLYNKSGAYCGYAAYFYYDEDGNQKIQYLHRLLCPTAPDMCVDHINGDTLDNRRSNLREVTKGQNCMNKRKPSNNTSGYKGVSLHRLTGKYVARICFQGERTILGYYVTPEEANAAYQAAALILFGEYNRKNANETN